MRAASDNGPLARGSAFAHDETRDLCDCGTRGGTGSDLGPRGMPVVARDVSVSSVRASGDGAFGGLVVLTDFCACRAAKGKARMNTVPPSA